MSELLRWQLDCGGGFDVLSKTWPFYTQLQLYGCLLLHCLQDQRPQRYIVLPTPPPTQINERVVDHDLLMMRFFEVEFV